MIESFALLPQATSGAAPAWSGSESPRDLPDSPGVSRGLLATLLLVDDEDRLRRVTARSLRQIGYDVLEAASETEALDIWYRHGAKVSLLLTDVFLRNRSSGFRLASQLKRFKPTVKVVVSSGFFDGLSPELNSNPWLHFLSKPYDFDTLARTVRECLNS